MKFEPETGRGLMEVFAKEDSLADRYLAAASGDKPLAAALLAKGLMQGDRAVFRAGYSRENALLAAAELFEIGTDAIRPLLDTIEPRPDEERRSI